MPQAYLFDMDGVILDTQHLKERAAPLIFQSHFGLDISAEIINQCFEGIRFDDYASVFFAEHGMIVSAEQVARTDTDRYQIFYQLMGKELPFIPETLQLIQHISA